MKRDDFNLSVAEIRLKWKQGLRQCANCKAWVPCSEWHRQYRCISAMGICRACIIEDDERAHRVAPEARIELKKVPIPSRTRSLFDFEEDDDA